jgi:hypothetical protein
MTMADEKTTFEIALKDSISPQLKQIARDLKALNASVAAGTADTAKGGSETVTKLSRGVQGLANVTRQSAKELVGVTAFFGGLTKGLLGAVASIEGVKSLAAALQGLAQHRVQLSLYSENLGTSALNLERLARATAHMGLSSEQSATIVASISAKWQDLRTLQHGSQTFKELAEVGPGGERLADELIQTKDLFEAIMKIIATFEKAPEGGKNLLAQRFGAPTSFFSRLKDELANIRNPYLIDKNIADEFFKNIKSLEDRFDDEWARFAAHAMPKITEFMKYINEQMKKDDWDKTADAFWDEFANRLQTTIREAQELAKIAQPLADLLNKLTQAPNPDEARKALQDAFGKATGQTPRGEAEQQRMQQEEHKLLEDIRDALLAWQYVDEGHEGEPGFYGEGTPGVRPGGEAGGATAGGAKVPQWRDEGPKAGALPGGAMTAEEAGIKPDFPVAPGVNWKHLDAEYLARMNRAYRDMPESEKAKFRMISGYRPATREEARKLGMSESSSQEDIWERSGHGTRFAAAPPGRSRHQGGQAGDYTVTDWLRAHGAQYGVTDIGASYDYPHIQMRRGGPSMLDQERARQRQNDQRSDREKIDRGAQKSVWDKGKGDAIKFMFNNVPPGVKTNAEATGSFTDVTVSRKSAMEERAD